MKTSPKTWIIATRKSPLALWQAQFAREQIKKIFPDICIEIKGYLTEGDQNNIKKQGKDLFVRTLQQKVIAGEADLAVHSLKDMSVSPHAKLCIAAVLKREDARDVFISKKFKTFSELPEKARIGTSSPRRVAQIKRFLPFANTQLLRGNIETRLAKLKQDNFDAILLAAAGLIRLNWKNEITEYLDADIFIPAIGQGAIALECNNNNEAMIAGLKKINDIPTALCITAERAVNQKLGGDCYTPIAAHAIIRDNLIYLKAMVGSLDGKNSIYGEKVGPMENSKNLGFEVAEILLAQGAASLLGNNKK